MAGDNMTTENYSNFTFLCKQTADFEHCHTDAATTNETLKTDIYKELHSTSKNKAEQNAYTLHLHPDDGLGLVQF